MFYVSGKEGFITSKDGINWGGLTASKQFMKYIVTNGSIMLGIRVMDDDYEYLDPLSPK